MGRAARAKKVSERRIKLAEADYHKLVSQSRHVEIVRLEAREKAMKIAAEIVEKEVASIQATARQTFDALATKYGFDPKASYRFEEATCELVLVTA